MNLWNEALYRPIYNLFILVYDIIPYKDAGVAIILITLFIRFSLLPLSWSSVRSQRMMQALGPQLEKIKQQYKGDQQGLTKATMDLYKKYDINPLSSCLPLLLQLPILIALYQVLRNINLDQTNLLYSFIPRPETFNSTFLGFIDLTKPFYPLAILAGIAQFVQGYQLQAKKPKKAPVKSIDPDKEFDASSITSAMTTQFVYIMPLMTVFISWNLFAGLPLYWVTTTLFSIFSQVIAVKLYPVPSIKNIEELPVSASPVEYTIPQDEVLETKKEKNVTISVKKRASSE